MSNSSTTMSSDQSGTVDNIQSPINEDSKSVSIGSQPYIYVLHHPDCKGNCDTNLFQDDSQTCTCNLLHYKPQRILEELPIRPISACCASLKQADVHGPHRSCTQQCSYDSPVINQGTYCKFGQRTYGACPCIYPMHFLSEKHLAWINKYRDLSPSEGYWKTKMWHGVI
ncbi:hypothetical protein PHET_06458 [Paragonimus heterotremus]|uniref:Uncharacterized protein n=1 Tax=Paragonimus heterotremus TaxID=100268 RepID=A0A8J4SN96_9TREM|nr:hypothetical protein PHET_06458 [Paragonimus heterotremus]